MVAGLPVTGELLRASLIERTVRHTRGCTICAGGRTRQLSLRREQVKEVRRWPGNYHKLKEALEEICELNHGLLRDVAEITQSRRARSHSFFCLSHSSSPSVHSKPYPYFLRAGSGNLFQS
jgi:hypothetical protein